MTRDQIEALRAELAEARRHHGAAGDRLARADTLLAEHAAALKPPPVVTAPPWQDGTIARGRADAGYDTQGAVTVELRATTGDPSASDSHDRHVTFDPVPAVAWQAEILLNRAMLDARTWKFGGVVAFDGDWSRWPGGDTARHAIGNAMSRLCGWHWDRKGSPRLSTLITGPQSMAADGAGRVVGGVPANWVSNGGHTVEWLHVPAKAGEWFSVRHEIEPGEHRTYVEGDLVLRLVGLPLPAKWNRAYVSCMIGGSSPLDLPRSGEIGVLSYRDYRVEAL